ncbi:MAG: hypothetical protein ACYSTI_09985 [Planctomycetota bacterium]|jgi:hypothetical protein
MVNREGIISGRLKKVKARLAFTSVLLSLATLLVISGASCSTPAEAKSEDAIYAAAVHQLYTVDHTFGEPPNFPIIYLVETTDDGVGDPDAPQTNSNLLLSSVQEAITAALDDLPAEFVWVGNFNEVPLDSNTGAVEGNGAIITLGNVHFQEDGSALVSASIYFANLGAGGLTYIVESIDGVWQVTGNTGVLWMA